jgi:glycosyltransferase XagB
LYWMLVSVAAYRALWQLVFGPFHWEKTPHGNVLDG